ncbi:hypothetical protein LSH36_543g00008 [Paralvinella palmiformis]|uniref:Uncharacterized protein n=1 Tax=Paralvinella palmiformis TaxID=53620 RepID=A0AAD9MXD0_9ANNE|nr:hypothetical protein LSH36_543g00008 [Paralvinella palmiformis]
MTSNTAAHMEPDWARVPPHVPTYPNPPAYFRQKQAEYYTAPDGQASYQRWWDKWHIEHPDWKDEHYRTDPRTPVMRWRDFQPGTNRPAHIASWNKPPWRQEYRKQGLPVTEATRARGLNRIHVAVNDHKLYQFSNNMTSTQYKKPVTSIYGPLMRENVFGVNTQRNKHGFMGFQDYYF